jgi:hypothetical protein
MIIEVDPIWISPWAKPDVASRQQEGETYSGCDELGSDTV